VHEPRASRRAIAARLGGLAWLVLVSLTPSCARSESPAATVAHVPDTLADGRATSFLPPLARPPLDTLVVTGNFGERRTSHFHAGLDLATGSQTGAAVMAPLPGWIERVRASGAGYGRSLYFHGDDGRLLVFGHLDAYAEPVASWVDSTQRAAGQYEQDLWTQNQRFRYAAGDTIAWSGESGAGPPHLHMEVRIGDMAMNPLRAGVELPDTVPPVIDRIALEPLDDRSRIQGVPAPWSGRPRNGDTLVVDGRLRVRVAARDAISPGRAGTEPWWTSVEFGGKSVSCRFDSVSWATDMAQVNQVFAGDALRLWNGGGPRLRVIMQGGGDGILTVGANDPPRLLTARARDTGGGVATCAVWLRPPAAGEAPRAQAAAPRKHVPGTGVRIEPAGVGFTRVVAVGLPAGLSEPTVEIAPLVPPTPLTATAEGYSAIIAIPRAASANVVLRGTRGGAAFEFERAMRIVPCAVEGAGAVAIDSTWRIEGGSLFEPGVLAIATAPTAAVRGLVPVTSALSLTPALAQQNPCVVSAQRPMGADPRRTMMFYDDGGGWEWIRSTVDSTTGAMRAETRRLGRFALFTDETAPRVVRVRRHTLVGHRVPYSRWALEAVLSEGGSGIDASATRFEIDGVAVPSEWDGEKSTLRWRPRARPAAGTHTYRVVVTDRAGNVGQKDGTFVLN
jgi:hypothetical protein